MDGEVNRKSATLLYPYQQQGVEHLCRILTHPDGHRGALLADPPGLGKSAQAIATFDRLDARRALVLCPASLKLNWVREFALWAPGKYGTQVLHGGKDEIDPRADVVIVSYGLACREPLSTLLRDESWGMLIADESQTLRSPASQVSRVVLVLIWAACKYRLLLTGTPIPNGRAAEAWPMFSRLAPDAFGQWQPYRDRYCIAEETPYGVKYPRSKNLQELGAIARERFMVRRRAEDVLGQLPPLVRQTVPLEVPALAVQEAQDGIVDLSAVVRGIERGDLPTAGDPISTARRKLGALKVQPAMAFLEDLLDEVPHVVLFCHHRDVYEGLQHSMEAKGVTVVGIHGLMRPEDRQSSVDAFQRGEAEVILCSLTAAGTGLTLTMANTVVFVEFDWVPTANEQAEKRIHRIGQTELCRAIYLVVPESLDEAIQRSVHRKMKDIERVMAA